MKRFNVSASGFGRLSWVIILGLLAVGGGLAWHFIRGQNSGPEYQTVTVLRGDLTNAVTATGTLNPVVNVQVGSQISGIIQTLKADYNSPVKKGEVIAVLDPATYEANVSSAEGDLANANAALELAQVNARRSEELLKNNLIAQSDFDQSTATLHQAEAQVKIKQAALQRAKVDLARCTIYAPVDGMVISRSVDVGQTVAASLSAPTIFIIANDLTKMQIDANVAEADVGGVEEGQDVEFTVDAFPYRTFHGTVTQVRNSPITVQNVVTYDTVISVNNADLKLKPGMTANVSIIIARRHDVLTLANAALRFHLPTPERASSAGGGGSSTRSGDNSGARSGGEGGRRKGGGHRDQRTVYTLVTNPKADPGAPKIPQPVEIKVGISDGLSTEITDGLKENEQVITSMVQSEDRSGAANNPFSGMRRRF